MKFITFHEDDVKAMVNDLNIGLHNIKLDDNFNGKRVVLFDIPSGEFNVPHDLKRVPSYRIILSQEGGSYIIDKRGKWTDKYIVMYANTPVDRLELFIGV